MFNNRMLAVAAVLVMAVPALGAATPIVVPPVPEQLVEGHTVFTVIEIVAATQTNETRFAAAVAVLVREYQARNAAQRFPGVLWFNDQYLVNPVQNANEYQAFRYPCGGAVMAVNAGDPDPRVVIADVSATTPAITGVAPAITLGTSVGDDTQTYNNPPWVKPYPGTYTYNNDYAWVGGDVDGGTIDPATGTASGQDAKVWSDTVIGTVLGSDNAFTTNESQPWDYRESYLITDPNDHSWVIDLYNFYTREEVSVSGGVTSDNADNLIEKEFGTAGPYSEEFPQAFGGDLFTEYAYPVWVVNVLGSPVFVPDYGIAIRAGSNFIGENCVPFKDLIDTATAPLNGALCATAIPDVEYLDNQQGGGNDTDITANAYNGAPPWTDDPCMGYQEPSRNGMCYGGQESQGACPHGSPGNTEKHYKNGFLNEPYRQYNALLYFKLEDLRVPGANKDHSDPYNSPDTNGCSEEQYAWGPNPPQAANDWPCPGGDDDLEGNSHPFHPNAPPHEEAEDCLPAFSGPNPTNHGGSTYIAPGTRADDDGWFQVTAPCDYLHATRNIDIYFSPAGRPFIPVVRDFNVVDLEGSSAPFQDYHQAYPGQP